MVRPKAFVTQTAGRRGISIDQPFDKPLHPDACPYCGRKVYIRKDGTRGSHHNTYRRPCDGAGLRGRDVVPVDLADLPPVVIPGKAGGTPGRRANPWSGKKDTGAAS